MLHLKSENLVALKNTVPLDSEAWGGFDLMEVEKKCPKCPNSPVMKKSEFMTIIPAMGETRYGTQGKAISERAGIPLRSYECLACHLVEFYHEEIK
jgi:predicted nucleic-acid-binding Zn-ribbon protein